jgi:hypothetical protein
MTRILSTIVLGLLALPAFAFAPQNTLFEPLTLGAAVDMCTTLTEDFFAFPQEPPPPPDPPAGLDPSVSEGRFILGRSAENGRCLALIEGFVAGEAMRESPRFCNPSPGNRYAKHMIAAAMVRWGATFPERLDRPAGPEIIFALTEFMPCSEEAGPEP